MFDRVLNTPRSCYQGSEYTSSGIKVELIALNSLYIWQLHAGIRLESAFVQDELAFYKCVAFVMLVDYFFL